MDQSNVNIYETGLNAKTALNLAKMSRNIKLNYVFSSLVNFNPASALWVVYMTSKGLDLWQIGIAEAILHVTIFVMELPTGMIADIFGRKVSRVAGAFLWFLGQIAMILANTFPGFCLSFLLSGLGITLESGAGDALVYDSLKASGLEASYKKIAGRIVLAINLSEAAAILLGGLLSDIRFIYAYIVAAAFEFAAFVASLLFVEPPAGSEGRSRNAPAAEDRGASYLSRLKESFVGQFTSSSRLLGKNRRVLSVILLSGIFDMTACLCYFYGRKLFEEMGWTQGSTGIIYMLYCLLGALTAFFIHRLDSRFGEKRVIFAMCIGLILGFGIFSHSSGLLPAAAFLLIGTAYGASYPLFTDYINREIPSDCRATILSLNGAMFSFSMIAFFPLVGLLGDAVGLGKAFSTVFIPLALILLLLASLMLRLGSGNSARCP